MIEVHDRPGLTMTDSELFQLHQEIMSVAQECLDEIPFYQCLTGNQAEYSRLIIAVARSKEGTMLGFCSSYVLAGGDLGEILHLGLTCVSPKARRMGLTHKLTSKVVCTYLWRYSLFRASWVTNVACVVSSLGSVALHFQDVYPSPFMEEPTFEHQQIARLINQKYRRELFINPEATFDDGKFLFERSVSGTMFEKSHTDKKFYHRDHDLTQFYLNRINFSNGDEILQVGKISLLSFPFYLLKTIGRKFRPAKMLESSRTVA